MRKKSRTMAGRLATIVGVSMAGVWSSGAFPALILGVAGAAALGYFRAGVTVTKRSGKTEAALPAPIQESIDRVVSVAPALSHGRHRQGLRAVTQRALHLVRDPSVPADATHELASAIDTATIAAARLDALDDELERLSLDDANADNRALMLERDRWASRLLELTATLDGFVARLGAARASDPTERDDELDALRAKIEALEEVQSS